MSPGATLALRDIHLPVQPGWWPPAPGWWLLAGLVAAIVAVVAGLAWRRRRRRRALEQMFDARMQAAATAPGRIAVMSELLRRAALGCDPAVAALRSEDWLAWLDRDAKTPVFDGQAGRLLLDGGYRRKVDEAQLQALHAAARARFIALAERQR